MESAWRAAVAQRPAPALALRGRVIRRQAAAVAVRPRSQWTINNHSHIHNRRLPSRRLPPSTATAPGAPQPPPQPTDGGAPSSPPPYADWVTLEDGLAAERLAAKRMLDDDEYLLDEAMKTIPTPSPWWEVLELSATAGAVGGGVAAVLMGEATLAVLVAALPLVGPGRDCSPCHRHAFEPSCARFLSYHKHPMTWQQYMSGLILWSLPPLAAAAMTRRGASPL